MKLKTLLFPALSILLTVTAKAQRPQSIQTTKTTQPTGSIQPGTTANTTTILRADDPVVRIKKLEDENARLTKEMNDLKENLKVLTTKFAELKQANIDTKISIVGVKYTMGNIQTSLDSLQASYKTHYHTVNGVVGNAVEEGHVLYKSGAEAIGKAEQKLRNTSSPKDKQ